MGQVTRLAVGVLLVVAGVMSGVRAFATLEANGPALFAYKAAYNGFADPSGPSEPSTFNAQANVFGATVPPASALTGSTSTFGGSPGASVDLTTNANLVTGAAQLACLGAFANLNGLGNCVAASGSTFGKVNGLVLVQSWPFYVGASTSSNVNPGTFSAETTSVNGSYLVLAPAAFTYAQPANFQGATGLAAGTALVNNGLAHSTTSRTGTFAVAAGNCGANIYWLTWEYFEALGGSAAIEYSWKPPGTGALEQVTQGVVWGQVSHNGTPAGGDTITVSVPGSANATLTTDANGCYGYNYAPFAGPQTISVTATTGGAQSSSSTTSLTMGNVQQVNFNFAPKVTMYKRITQVVTFGPTPGPATTPQTIVPTPDPTNPAGVTGTSSFLAGVYPGDTIGYTIFFTNTGNLKATGAPVTTGPTFSDNIPANTTLVAGSPAFTCCTNPTSTIGATITSTASAVTWAMASPLPVSSTGGISGTLALQLKVQ